MERWEQRFKNFEKAYSRLENAMQKFDNLNELEQVGLVQTYQYTFELAWKTLKDYLVLQGIDVKFPRDVIKNSYSYEIISNGEVWLQMLKDRNSIAHIYSEKIFKSVLNDIKSDYFDEITKLYKYLGAQL